ncbi:hypothetical protein [Streptomyces mobaraensis]|uniref:Uncharacterized protein n=1 Tax=Streptomyces mobaraensis TaxID=35621 RepID=A0A5N5W0L1_STRMB|nr:hypothetical protein [Streptomyces mobaraensis]KAB7834079.1 hypothetical protein FRZ00_30940 [Streptomyces mobaraensis]
MANATDGGSATDREGGNLELNPAHQAGHDHGFGDPVIKPRTAIVSVFGRKFPLKEREFWLVFDTRLVVELSPTQAKDLAYQLADECDLVVYPRDGYPAARWAAIRRRWRTARQGWSRAQR